MIPASPWRSGVETGNNQSFWLGCLLGEAAVLLEKPCRGKPENWGSVAGPAALGSSLGACRPLLRLRTAASPHIWAASCPRKQAAHISASPPPRSQAPSPEPLSNSAVACPNFPKTTVLGCSPQKTPILTPGPPAAYPGLQAALAPWNPSSSRLLGSDPTRQKPYTGTSSPVTRGPVCPSPTRRARKEDFKSVCLGC